MTKIGFIGGTGVEGKGLAIRLAAAGASVAIGSRSEERALAAADQYNKILGKPLIRGVSNHEMLSLSDIVFLTVRFDQAVAAVESCREAFRPGQVLVDVTVPVKFEKGQPEYLEQEEAGSGAELIAGHVPEGVSLVCAFKTMPAKLLGDLDTELQCDEFICGDSKEARQRIVDMARTIPTLRPVDVGPLKTARILERMTVLAIRLNRLYKRDGARYRIVGI